MYLQLRTDSVLNRNYPRLMLNPSSRLLRLLTLLQMRRFWSGHELAESLEITERTVRRDIDKLKSLGYPIEGTPGVAGGYQMGAGASLPPLQLDDNEALAVSLGLSVITNSSVSGVDEAALRALVKLERVLPSTLKKRATALRHAIQPLTYTGPRVASAMLSTIASAVIDHLELQFAYEDKSGRRSERLVDPLGLVPTATRWYLVAWDQGRADFRTFRVDRIQAPLEVGRRFTPRSLPCDGDLRSYVSKSVTVQAHDLTASIILHAPYSQLQSRVSPYVGVLEAVDEQHCRLRTGDQVADTLLVWVLHLDVDFTIESPPSLKDDLRAIHERIGRLISSC